MRWQLVATTLILAACGGSRGHLSTAPGEEAGCQSREACSARCATDELRACDDLVLRVRHDDQGPRYGATAASAYQLACDHGSPRGCDSAGQLYAQGRGVTVDGARAQALFERARTGFATQCREGFAPGCGDQAELYRRGRGVPRDDAQARDLADQGCRGDDGLSCWSLWQLQVAAGDDAAELHARAIERLGADCDGGSVLACEIEESERLRMASTSTTATPTAPDPLAAPCSADPPELCDRLPAALATMAGSAIVGAAAELARGSCARDHEPGCYMLALTELTGVGIGTKRDVASGLARLEAACTAGHAMACEAMAQAISNDLVAGKAAPDGVSYQRRACDLDLAAACERLGDDMFDGRGPFERELFGPGPPGSIPEDRLRGAALLERACDLGAAGACTRIGMIYWNGWLQVVDQPRAVRALHQGCAIGGAPECASERAYTFVPPTTGE